LNAEDAVVIAHLAFIAQLIYPAVLHGGGPRLSCQIADAGGSACVLLRIIR
jgi:hypothetical protein